MRENGPHRAGGRAGAWLAAITLAVGLLPLAARAAGPESFRLKEYLGQTWRNEAVSFTPTPAQLKAAQAGNVLLGPDGAPVAYQLVPGTPARVELLTDLGPFETREWRFGAAGKAPLSDLRVEETATDIRVSNSLTGVALAKSCPAGSSPLLGFKVPSGAWVGGSALVSDVPVSGYSAKVVARGPVYAEVACTVQFGKAGQWELRIRLNAREPVLQMEDTGTVSGAKATFLLSLDRGLPVDTLMCRAGKGDLSRYLVRPVAAGEVFVLEPWLHWWERDQQGLWCGFFGGQSPDLVAVAAHGGDAWVDLKLPAEQRVPTRLMVLKDDRGLHLDLPLMQGRRQWLLMGLGKAESTEGVADGSRGLEPGPLPMRYLIKYGHVPLRRVQSEVLAWDWSKQAHPHLLFTPADVQTFRKNVTDLPGYVNAIPGYLKQPLGEFTSSGPVAAYLATGDEALGKYLAEQAVQMMQAAVELFTKQTWLMWGQGPHYMRSSNLALGIADLVLNTPHCTPEQRQRLLSQAAFMGYTYTRPDLWAPELGFSANPNMTTWVANGQAALGCFLSTHPQGKAWAEKGINELKRQLEGWSDENGGWLEAPHYAMVSYDAILGGFLMARNAGLGDYVFAPKMRKVIEWFAKITTPPDTRAGGYRHFPPLGNTYINEPSGEFGTVAYLWKDRDPEFAAQMQWMYQQHRSWNYPGIGGPYPALNPYRPLLLDPSLPVRPPEYRSEVFPQTGVVLRNGYPSERETYLHMIQGDNHSHYDMDSGSVVIFGKGRSLCDDFGYYAEAPPDDHNLLESPLAAHRGTMQLSDFSAAPQMDYVAGRLGGWQRQIALVKSPDPLGPNYFVFCDTLAVPAPGTWRLYCTVPQVKAQGQQALVEGGEDVDMDVIFALPQGVALSTESRMRRSICGFFADGHQGPYEQTQVGLLAKNRVPVYTAVLYPRLKTEAAPTVTSLAEGKVLKISTAEGTDYVLLSGAPFDFAGEGISFHGMAGAVLQRGGKTELVLGSGGKLTAGGQTVTSQKPLPVRETNQMAGGDFEAASQEVFRMGSGGDLPLVATNPVPAGPAPAGKQCLSVVVPEGGTFVCSTRPVYVDATKIYRVSIKVFTAEEILVDIAGYGVGEKPGNLTDAAGQHWQWGFWTKGPHTEWQTLEVTIGPPGSGAAQTWAPRILSTSWGFWIRGGPGKVYLDDARFEELPPVQ